MSFNNGQLNEALKYIDPANLDYQTWLYVGMALKHEGYSYDVWDEWSKSDSGRYHAGECEKKWDSFTDRENPVTGATIIKLAKDNGMTFFNGESKALDWEDEISYEAGGNDFPEREPHEQLIEYLRALFSPDENVGYVVASVEKDGKFIPANKGNCDRTAGQLIDRLSKCGGDIGRVLGDYNPKAGAWIRFNPLDGKGVKNENVTDFRYALVESDCLDVKEQYAIIRKLELPARALVYSGNKSLHAIVNIGADSYDEYRKRVEFLYSVCQKHGLKIDTQNKNPSRLSRMPGVIRKDSKQCLIATNIGKKSFSEWSDWVEGINDDLPEVENMETVWDNLPELAEPLIEGVLRQGHKMLVAGPSKAGKSYALIELCAAIAEGEKWLGFKCTKGKVLYVNLELDRASCLHRFKDVYSALGFKTENIRNIDIWNLRGKSVPMDKLAPKLICRAAKKEYIAVIIDPIYKVITGDENSASDMSNFCNQFDKVCTELSCAVIYCHHHSKGAQGAKRSMDRASGSGVFARDPDALLDLIELDVSESLIKEEKNKAVCKLCLSALDKIGYSDYSQDDTVTSQKMMSHAKKALSETEFAELTAKISEAERKITMRSAWRIDGTLREFPKFPALNLWFDYPIHRVDEAGALKDLNAEGDLTSWQVMNEKRRKQAKKQNDGNKEKLEQALLNVNCGEPATVKEVAEYLDVGERTVRRWLDKFDYELDSRTKLIRKKDSDTT